MRKPFLAGNWKMNLDRRSALDLARAVRDGVGSRSDREVALCPPFVYLDEIARTLAASPVRLGAQNMCDEASGAFTGEVSGAMLCDVGCELVILGHSERRHIYGETDELVASKLVHALDLGLEVILCVGELLEERAAERTEEVVRRQTSVALRGLGASEMEHITLAYEPVWAIGTGQVATPEQAGDVHDYLRGVLAGLLGEAVSEAVRIQYGGSVKPDNVSGLMVMPGIDGALVGGASLEASSFLSLINFEN